MPSTVLSQAAAKNVQSTTYTIPQVMMTLAQLAVTAGAQRPSGETLKQHQMRIFDGINALLSNADLATNAEWKAVWIGLTDDRANLAYIAQNTSQNAFAVCLRGTQVDSFIDLLEDNDVGTVVPFTAGPSHCGSSSISRGAAGAFNEVTKAVYVRSNTNLLQALESLLGDAPPQPTLYITGHSLGGAMATTVALYLAAQNWTNEPTFGVYTFAAPTAGVQSFADCFDSVFGEVSQRYYNAWDVVPTAWGNSSMTDMQNSFYPSIVTNPEGPGPAQAQNVNKTLSDFINKPGKNVYVQTNQKQGSVVLNSDYSAMGTTDFGPGSYNTLFLDPTMAGFMGQVGFQHNNYLAFLGAPQIPSLIPVISSPISPNAGPSAGGTVITIEGSNFTPDCLVDFQSRFKTVPAEKVTFVSATKIMATSPSLPLQIPVDVRVTNMYGTSAVVSCDQFAPNPVSAPAVSAITPSSGPAEAGYTVTITGAGFTSDCSVFFGETAVTPEQTTIVNLTEILVSPPASGIGTVAVTVTKTGSPGNSNTPTFTYGPPAITNVTPSFGFMGKKDNASVTITGAGFGSSQGNGAVQFASSLASHPCQNILSWSDTEIVVTPYDLDGLAELVPSVVCDIVVTSSNGLTSAKTPADQFTYYNLLSLKS